MWEAEAEDAAVTVLPGLVAVAAVEAIQKLLLAYPLPLTPRILLLLEQAEPLAIQRMWLVMEELLLFLEYLLREENVVLLYHITAVPAELVALVVAVDPSVVTIRKLPTRVECGGTLCRGMVVSDFRERPIDAPFASICMDVDSERAVEELLGAFLKP